MLITILIPALASSGFFCIIAICYNLTTLRLAHPRTSLKNYVTERALLIRAGIGIYARQGL